MVSTLHKTSCWSTISMQPHSPELVRGNDKYSGRFGKTPVCQRVADKSCKSLEGLTHPRRVQVSSHLRNAGMSPPKYRRNLPLVPPSIAKRAWWAALGLEIAHNMVGSAV